MKSGDYRDEDVHEQKENIWKRIQGYFKTHIWCSFAVAIFASVLVIVFILIGYLKNQYYDYLMENAYDTENALLSSVNKNIENQMETFIEIGSTIAVHNFLASDIDQYVEGDADDAYSIKIMKNSLSNLSDSSGSIAGIAIVSEEGVIFQYARNEVGSYASKGIWNEENEMNLTRLFPQIKKNNEENILPRYSIIKHPSVHPNIKSQSLIHIAFPIKSGHDYSDMKYMMVISYDSAPLYSFLKQLSQGQRDNSIQGYIEDGEGEILLHTSKEYVGSDASQFKKEENLTELYVPVGNYGWILHGVIDGDALMQKVSSMYQKAMTIYIFAILLVLIILVWITKKILRPVDVISQSIHRVKCGDMQERIQIEGTNEIWQLAREYNEMIYSIREANRQVAEQHDQVIESMKMKQRAEREALESQINAHFICNTLNAINYEAIESGNYKVSVLLKKLSNILRYTFDQKHQNVYFFQEISWIEQYLFLQKERMESVFDYRIEFDSDYDNWPCRKLMLQPFVENSILHGFEGMKTGGMIHIVGEGYQEYLKIVIEDNGQGMSQERKEIIEEIIRNPMAAKEKGMGIGISNVITRMKMYYGEEIQISLETEEGKGTRFIFILPDSGKM